MKNEKVICPNCGEVVDKDKVVVVKDSLGNCATCPACKSTADIELFEEGMITEYCPHCEKEVELENKFEKQICPDCKHEILPCSICNEKCINCPLE